MDTQATTLAHLHARAELAIEEAAQISESRDDLANRLGRMHATVELLAIQIRCHLPAPASVVLCHRGDTYAGSSLLDALDACMPDDDADADEITVATSEHADLGAARLWHAEPSTTIDPIVLATWRACRDA